MPCISWRSSTRKKLANVAGLSRRCIDSCRYCEVNHEQLLAALAEELIRTTKAAKQSLADGLSELEKTLAERRHDRAEDL